MENLSARALTGQLSEDLGWLEQYAKQRPGQELAGGLLRLAAGLIRNCVGPIFDGEPPTPLHVVVVGGAGAGKSTVANLLSGVQAAEANPQAGFTRHPIAYTSYAGPQNWSGHFGFLGPLQRLTDPAPSSLDQDVYQVRRVPTEPSGYDLLKEFVVWDCPDMTTWAAAGYIPRLIEAASLADILVYVASDERYNDEMPTQFLDMLLKTGKPVVCCLMKMREADAPALVAHFKKEVVSRLPPGVVGCLAIPFLTPQQMADPVQMAGRFRIPLVNQVSVLGTPAKDAQRRSVQGALRFLSRSQDQFLAVAREDVTAMNSWKSTVHHGQAEFDSRYYREYLASERFQGFDDVLIRLMQLLEVPIIGQVMYVLRVPFQLLKGALNKAINRPDALGRGEQPVLDDVITGWIDMLRKEAARNADKHPLWAHIGRGFVSGRLIEQTREKYLQFYRTFQVALADEINRSARLIYEELEKHPARLNMIRGAKLAAEVGIVGATIGSAGLLSPLNLAFVPLASGLTHSLVELVGKGYVDTQREQTRRRQQELLMQHVSRPLAEWLIQWPATGGSEFERLQLALRRVPTALKELEIKAHAALRGV